MNRRVPLRWALTTASLLLIVMLVVITNLQSTPTSAHQTVKLGTMAQNCDDQPPRIDISPGYWPCQTIAVGAKCLNLRTNPFLTAPVVGCVSLNLAAGDYLTVFCQTIGDTVTGITNIWDRLTPPDSPTATYVSDYYVATTNLGTFSYTIPRC